MKEIKHQQTNDAESWRKKHEHEIQQLDKQHQQDVDSWREKCDSLNTSNNEEIVGLREKVAQLETQLSNDRER
jgi:polyhydroxyalkanoate synthesis regulator phasin